MPLDSVSGMILYSTFHPDDDDESSLPTVLDEELFDSSLLWKKENVRMKMHHEGRLRGIRTTVRHDRKGKNGIKDITKRVKN